MRRDAGARFGAAIIGFNVRAHKQAAAAAKRDGIEIRYYNIIYNLVDDVKKAMSGLLAPTLRENFLGNAQILEVFNISKVGKVAGCRVTEGVVQRGANVRLIRDNVVIHEGKLSTLKRFKDEVKEVRRARNAAWRSRTTATCVPATSSSVIAWRRSSAVCKFKSYSELCFSSFETRQGPVLRCGPTLISGEKRSYAARLEP